MVLCLVVVWVSINIPDICFVGGAGNDGLGGVDAGEHRVIHVVIAVLTIATDAVEIVDGVEIGSEAWEMLVTVKICWVGLCYTLDMCV